jgi:hypothetical protein
MELREPRFERVRRTVGIGIALLLAVAVAMLYLRMSEARGAPGCVQAYAGARTSADSASIDAQKADPEPGRIEAAYGVTCGELRRRGQLR